MNASELKSRIEEAGHSPYFFTRETMKFFGDTMRNYGVRSTTIRANYDAEGNYVDGGIDVDVWELYRKRPVKNRYQSSAYFSKADYRRIHTIKGD